MSPPERPVLWRGPYECACGARGEVEVLGRKGHRYDELEAPPEGEDAEPTGEEHIREDYSGEARSVVDLAPCPSCKKRRRAGAELKRQALWLVVLLVMGTTTVLVLWKTNEPDGAKGAVVAAAIVIAARAFGFVTSWLEAGERARFALSPR